MERGMNPFGCVKMARQDNSKRKIFPLVLLAVYTETGFESLLGSILFLELSCQQSSRVDTIEGRKITATYGMVKSVQAVLQRRPSF